MRVTRVDTTVVAIPFKQPYVYSAGRSAGVNSVVVHVHTDAGITGIGEACGDRSVEAILGIVRSAADAIVGHDPFDIEAFLHRFYRVSKWDDMRRFANQALAGVEMALWDIIGKACAQPVYRLMGGLVQPRISIFGFVQGDTTAELAASAVALVEAGFDILYVKVGRGADTDHASLAAIRAAVGERVRIRVDANQAWSIGAAIRELNALAKYEIEFAEQPVGWSDLDGMAHVRTSVPMAVAIDQGCFTEAETVDVIKHGAADVLVVGPHEAGGLSCLKNIARIGAAAGLQLCRHATTGETGISTLASLHVLATLVDPLGGHQSVHQLLEGDLLVSGSLEFEAGTLRVPDGPGLGIELDPDRVAHYAAAYASHGAYYNQ